MAVPRFNFPQFLSRLHRAQGTATWDSMVTSLMREANRLLDQPDSSFSEEDIESITQLSNLILASQNMDPGRFGTLAETHGFQGLTEQNDTVDTLAAVGDILSSILGAGGVSNDRIEAITREITENISTQVDENTRRRITELTRRRVDRFVDVPTNEEFLDSFEVSFAGFVDGLRESGVSQRDIDFVMEDEEFFLTEFLGDLATRAERGEDIFKVVGTEGTPVKIGERFGGRTEETVRRSIVETEKSKISQTVREQIEEEQRTSGGELNPLQITEEVNRRTEQEINRRVEETLTSTEITTERILQRPRLATIFAQSPLDFLQGTFSPASVLIRAAGRRGTQQRSRDTATGPPVSTPRRVF